MDWRLVTEFLASVGYGLLSSFIPVFNSEVYIVAAQALGLTAEVTVAIGVAVSSTVVNHTEYPSNLVDGKLETAWNSRSGDLAGAETIFRECIGRAEHLAVAELKARSYEGLMRVAQRRNDRAAERKWLDAAMRAREDA